jgi:protein TonB
MSAKPSAKVIAIQSAIPPAAKNPRRAQRGHEIARATAISKLDARIAHLESLVIAALEQQKARSGSNWNFYLALAGSILLHIVVIGLVTFAMPDKSANKDNKPLEVVLVNAQSKSKPLKPQSMAQHNLDGGGNTDADKRAKSPMPVLRDDPQASELAAAQKRVEQLERETRQVLTRAKSNHTTSTVAMQPVPQTDVQTEAPPSPSITQAEIQRQLNIQRMEAEIAKQWEAYQKRPRRHSVGASAGEYRFARYVEDWRLKIEKLGEAHYPQAAREQKIYGSLLLIVSIKSNGALSSIEMRRSSGNKILDEAAKNIVRMGAPYPAFPPDIAKDTDVIDISRTWRFTSSDRLETE